MKWESGGDSGDSGDRGDSPREIRIWKDGKEVAPEDLDQHLKGMMGELGLEGLGDLQRLPALRGDNGSGMDKRIIVTRPGAGVGRGRLGVRIESLNPDLASALGSNGSSGVLVLEVLGGTAAEKAGIKAGDIIVSVGREAVHDADDLVRQLRDEEGRVSIEVVRRGVKRTFEATLVDTPQVMRFKSGDGQLGLGRLRDQDRSRVRIDRETDGDGLREELQKLRSELRDLKRELEDSKR